MFKAEFSEELNLISLEGNLDSSRSDEVRNLFSNTSGSLTVDMSNLDFICSSGVGILVMTYRQLKENNGTISLINLKPHIKKVFEISLLNTVFDIK